jgi:hypothetical protein
VFTQVATGHIVLLKGVQVIKHNTQYFQEWFSVETQESLATPVDHISCNRELTPETPEWVGCVV